jgi:hypothetical protein
MLHEAAAMMNGLGLMWSEKATPLDPEAFCWAARTDGQNYKDKEYSLDATASDQLVRVLAAQINQDGYFNVESVLKRHAEWTGQQTAVEQAKTDGQ